MVAVKYKNKVKVKKKSEDGGSSVDLTSDMWMPMNTDYCY